MLTVSSSTQSGALSRQAFKGPSIHPNLIGLSVQNHSMVIKVVQVTMADQGRAMDESSG